MAVHFVTNPRRDKEVPVQFLTCPEHTIDLQPGYTYDPCSCTLVRRPEFEEPPPLAADFGRTGYGAWTSESIRVKLSLSSCTLGMETAFQGYELLLAPNETFGIHCQFALVEPSSEKNPTERTLDFRQVTHTIKLELTEPEKFLTYWGNKLAPVYIRHNIFLPKGVLRGTKLAAKCKFMPWN